MFHKRSVLTISVLAAAAMAPIAASAADAQLGGAPTLRSIDAKHATLRFASDRLPKKAGGAIDARITFAGGQRVSGLAATGRHGSDVVYTARVTSTRDLRVGAKYTMTMKVARQATVTRKVKLRG